MLHKQSRKLFKLDLIHRVLILMLDEHKQLILTFTLLLHVLDFSKSLENDNIHNTVFP